jgi:class 3 adenylate cyclase/tetratricopeptide (TPR) repeat protein
MVEDAGRPCPRCQTIGATGARFCAACGASMRLRCAACGEELPDRARFCAACGQAIDTATHATPTESYTPRHLAQKILTSRSALQGERKAVTVLFCDVVSSTTLAERLGPDEMHALLRRFFDLALAEVHRYEGTVNQFLGDGFMALFGAPIAHEDHARRAVLAALDLRAAIESAALTVPSGGDVRLRLRMGLHTGFVIVGAIGDNLRMDYTAVGDVTHIAARLQQLAEPGQILLSDATARLVGDEVKLESRGPTAIRGRAEPIVVHELAGRRARRIRPEGVLSAFAGRERELRLLGDLLAEVDGGRGHAVSIMGEPGTGKSRLVFEFVQALDDRGLATLDGRCLSYGSAIPYVPVLDLLRGVTGIVDTHTPEQIVGRVAATLAAAGMDVSARAPYLTHLLGIKANDDRIESLESQALMARTFETLLELLVRWSRRRPLVMLVEDLHWIDQTSEAFLSALVERIAAAPVMLLATYRPGYRPPWSERSYATQFALRPLGPQASLAIVWAIAPRIQGWDALAQRILTRAEGNPFFLEELARAVADQPDNADAMVVPDTVHGVLTARIDRLSEMTKRVLQTASVLGREFSVGLLRALVDEPAALDASLAELARVEFLYARTEAEEPVYVFRHALTQEVARGTLLAIHRQDLHRRAARALHERAGERADDFAAVLAHHSYEGGAWSDAAVYARRAASAARRAYANSEALTLYDLALAASDRAGSPAGDRAALLEERAAVHSTLGAFDRARTDLEAALALSETSGDPLRRGRLLAALGALWGGHMDYTRGLDFARQAVEVVAETGDRRALAEARAGLGIMQMNLAQMDESRHELEQASQLLDAAGDMGGQARTLEMLAMNAWLRLDIDSGLRYAADAAQRLRDLGDRSTEASALVTLGVLQTYRGGWHAGEPALRRAVEIFAAIDARAGEAYAHVAGAESAVLLGLLDVAQREAGSALETAREIGHREWTALALSVLGRTALACGEISLATELHHEMLAIALKLGAPLWIAEAHAGLAEDVAASGQLAAAREHVAEALLVAGSARKFALRPRVFQSQLLLDGGEAERALAAARASASYGAHWRVQVAECRVNEGAALAALGDIDGAIAALSAATAIAAQVNAASPRWRAALTLSEILERAGRYPESGAEAENAVRILEAMGASLDESILRISFGRTGPLSRARSQIVKIANRSTR